MRAVRLDQRAGTFLFVLLSEIFPLTFSVTRSCSHFAHCYIYNVQRIPRSCKKLLSSIAKDTILLYDPFVPQLKRKMEVLLIQYMISHELTESDVK